MDQSQETEQVPLLSICIATYLSRDYLQACLASIHRFPPSCSYEVVVVNDYSDDGTAEMVHEEFPEVVFIENMEQVGICPAHNIGFRHSRGEYIVLLDADAELINETFAPLLNFMQNHSDAGIVTCTLVNSDGSLQPSGRRFPTTGRFIWNRLVSFLRLPINIYHQSYRNYQAVEEVDEVPITCLLMHRELGEPSGYFDEGIRVFYSDLELCYRIKSAGWKVYQIPDCPLLHHRGVNRKNPNVWQIVTGYRDELYFFKKWYPHSTVRVVKLIQFIEMSIRMIKWFLMYLAIPGRRQAMHERCTGGMTLLKHIWTN